MRGPGRFPTRVSMALAGLVLTVAGCSQALPLGPAPAPLPVPSRLASAIVLQPGLSDPGASVSKCPVGSVALSGPGAINGAPGGTWSGQFPQHSDRPMLPNAGQASHVYLGRGCRSRAAGP